MDKISKHIDEKFDILYKKLDNFAKRRKCNQNTVNDYINLNRPFEKFL